MSEKGKWFELRGAPLLEQLTFVMMVVGQTEEEAEFLSALREEGLGPETSDVPVTFSGAEFSAVVAGLSIIGLFSEVLGEAADAALAKLKAISEELAEKMTDEQKKALAEASERVMQKQMSAMFGDEEFFVIGEEGQTA